MTKPIISIVMPAYNVGKFISKAIDSIINQSFTQWELVIVDDCSTDNTVCLIKGYADTDKRIKLHQLQKNTGSAYKPRIKAIELSSGDWILNLDADDYLESTFLQSIYNRALETQADHVIPRMIRVSEENEQPTGWMCPTEDFNLKKILTGKEACMLTIENWEIGGAGLLVKRQNYFTALNKYPSNNSNINADELFTRKLLLVAKKVSFCNSNYYYRQNSNSITVKFSTKRFDILDTNLELKKLISNHFPKNSQEYLKMENHLCNGLRFHTIEFLNNKEIILIKDRKDIINKIKRTWEAIDWSRQKINILKKMLLGTNFHLFYLIYRLKHEK